MLSVLILGIYENVWEFQLIHNERLNKNPLPLGSSLHLHLTL